MYHIIQYIIYNYSNIGLYLLTPSSGVKNNCQYPQNLENINDCIIAIYRLEFLLFFKKNFVIKEYGDYNKQC